MVKRQIEKKLVSELDNNYILTMIGARQVGKTTLLKMLKELLLKKNKKVSLFTLEDKSLLSELNNHPKNIFNYIELDADRQFLLIDEIQCLEDPSNFLKYIYDLYQEKIKLIVTGSSAFYIDKKYKDSLAGRKKIFEIFPFTFSEFLLAKKEEKLSEKIKKTSYLINNKKLKLLNPEKDKIKKYLNEYFIFGSYPKVVFEKTKEDKKEYLKELYSSFLQKDIFEAGIKKELKFYDLLKLLAYQTGELLNVNELSNTLNISRDAIENYLYILEKSYIIKRLKPFHNNIRKEVSKMPKFYFLDSGYRNSILNMFDKIETRIDKGQSFELLFFNELNKQRLESINFWRTKDKNEVDFIVNEKFAFELKFIRRKFNVNKYKSFKQTYKNIPLDCVSYFDEEGLSISDFLS